MVVFRFAQDTRIQTERPAETDAALLRLLEPILKNHDSKWNHRQWLVHNSYLCTRLQDGPKCGLVALTLAGRNRATNPLPNLISDDDKEVDSLLAIARERGFSKQGEMFSAIQLAQLGRDVYGCNINAVALPSEQQLLQWLLDGHLVLFPYDRDRNNAPCNSNGSNAHWAIVKGFIIGNSEVNTEELSDWVELKPSGERLAAVVSSSDYNNVFVICLHGKSRHQGIWPLRSLLESNRQLYHPSTDLEEQFGIDGYIAPNDLIELRGHVVLVT